MKVWAFIANVDDIVEQYGFEVFEIKENDRFYNTVLMDYTNIDITTGEEIKVYFNGKELELPDAIFPMITNTDALMFEHLLVSAGCKSIINLDEMAVAHSKVATYQRLAKHGFAIPKTVIFFNHPDKKLVLDKLSYPFVVKPDNGYGGQGVMLINNDEEFDEYINELQPGITYIAQEYISTSKGKDLRVVFVEGEYKFSIIRQSNNPDEFRSNVHTGGEIIPNELDESTKKMCKKIADLFDLPIIGIDLLFGEDGYIVTEINASPGMEREVQYEVHRQVVEHFIEKCKEEEA